MLFDIKYAIRRFFYGELEDRLIGTTILYENAIKSIRQLREDNKQLQEDKVFLQEHNKQLLKALNKDDNTDRLQKGQTV